MFPVVICETGNNPSPLSACSGLPSLRLLRSPVLVVLELVYIALGQQAQGLIGSVMALTLSPDNLQTINMESRDPYRKI